VLGRGVEGFFNRLLSFANLREANLRHAELRGVLLISAKLRDADLSGAVLSGANMSDAWAWNAKQLTAADTLKGATMPDGRTLRSNKMPNRPTFEEWLQSQGPEEGTENE
jgi:uncharacterized protein YjbI with pentapeptide repeats